MINEVQGLLDEYLAWLRDKTVLRTINDKWVEITTPYLDRHNDYLQIYARRGDGGYVLTDDGHTLLDLQQTGCSLDTPRRHKLLELTINGFGVRLSNNSALEVQASRQDFALRKHNLVQAMLAVNDLFYTAGPMVKSLFFEDVVAWLDLHEVRYTPRVRFSGKTGYDHMFDFAIPRSRKLPERILRAINNPNRDSAEAFAFAWIDTRETRPEDSRAYAVVNDSERTISPGFSEALRTYAISQVLWSRRDERVQELAA